MKLNTNKVHYGKIDEVLFSLKDLEKLINFKPSTTTKNFSPTFFDNASENLSFNWPIPIWSSDKDSWPIKEIKKFINSSACHYKDCSRVNKKINLFCKKLEEIYNKPVDCHIYFSLNKKLESFKYHNDDYMTFIIVQEGTLKVTVDNNTKILKEKEFVFIPKNINHKVESLSEKRLSLSFVLYEGDGKFEERDWITI